MLTVVGSEVAMFGWYSDRALVTEGMKIVRSSLLRVLRIAQFPRRPLSGSPVNTGSLPLPQPKAHKLRFRRWYIAGLMSEQRYRLEQAFEGLRQALEAVESALLEYEETIHGEEAPDRSRQQQQQEEGGLDLLSIPEACQELGMGKSWVYQRLRSGEIPSLKLGKIIKIRREDLEEYLKSQYNPASSGEEGNEQP
jgi:excisionase family DNA binding protein